TRAWSSLAPASFPLGAPTGKRLILAAATAAGVFVGDVAVMAIWLGLAGGSPSSTFALWFVFAPAAVLSLLTLTYFVTGWLVARRRLAESSSLLGSVLLLLLALALGSGCGGRAAAPPAIGNSLAAA